MLGKYVRVKVTHPIHSHSSEENITYDLNFGQVEGGTIQVVLTEDSGYDAQQNRNDVTPVEINVEFGNMYTKEIESFGRSVLDGQPIEVPAEDAIQVQKVIYAAYESAETGKFVKL